MTDHSCYIGWTRGYSAMEIIRLLKTLSRNPMPINMEKLIRECVNGRKFYRATMTLRNREYCVQSEDMDILKQLLATPLVKDAVPTKSHHQLQEVKNDTTGKITYHFPINPGKAEDVKRACRNAGIPLIDEYDPSTSTMKSIPIDLNLKEDTVRDYQSFAVSRLFWNGFKCHSGILVLPCGAGKTLIGINVVATLKKPTMIFCQSVLAVTQWKEQILRWTNMQPSNVSRFSASHSGEWNPEADVLITTYGMFSANPTKRSSASMAMMSNCKDREWGLMVLDEVHLVPAKIFRKVTNQIKSHVKLGLTATMVREDLLIPELPNLVGPKLYELDIFTLRMRNYIAPVQCVELTVPMTQTFKYAYNSGDKEEQKLIYSTNPNKTRVVDTLIKRHLAKRHRIMVFCDNLFCLHFYTQMLNKPKIDGQTPQDERAQILANFRKAKDGDCVLFSQVGDQSIDLPEADVVIQVALMHGSRMQEGQRIGRIQRYEKDKETSYFYSLISRETYEEDYAEKRRHFLQDHGYTVKREKNDAWEKYLTEDNVHFLSPQVQEGLLQLLQKELRKREDERANKAERQIGGNSRPVRSSTKRKRSENSRSILAKKIKKTSTD